MILKCKCLFGNKSSILVLSVIVDINLSTNLSLMDLHCCDDSKKVYPIFCVE